MNTGRAGLIAVLCIGLFASCKSASPQAPAPGRLEGTSWRLVQIASSNDTTRAAIDRSRYTIGFGAAGVLNVRFDCNRGRGSWKSTGLGNLEFGTLELTRAMCPIGSLHDELVRQWPYVRSYLLKDGRLYLALMADGGTIEFESAP